MNVDDKFRKMALEDNWIALGSWLNLLTQDCEENGFTYPQDAVQAVAEIRGTKPASLRNQMTAAAWLKDNHPKIYSEKPSWLGMMQVVLLSRLAVANPDEAKKVAPKVFSGDLSQAEMRQLLENARPSKPSNRLSQGHSRSEAQRRTHKFERAVKEYLKLNSKLVFGHDGLEVVDGRSLEPLGTDILVKLDSEPLCAVEIRGPRTRIDPSYIVDQLARAALILRRVPYLIYVVPEDSEYDVEELLRMRNKLEIEGIRFADVPEKERLEYGDFMITD